MVRGVGVRMGSYGGCVRGLRGEYSILRGEDCEEGDYEEPDNVFLTQERRMMRLGQREECIACALRSIA